MARQVQTDRGGRRQRMATWQAESGRSIEMSHLGRSTEQRTLRRRMRRERVASEGSEGAREALKSWCKNA